MMYSASLILFACAVLSGVSQAALFGYVVPDGCDTICPSAPTNSATVEPTTSTSTMSSASMPGQLSSVPADSVDMVLETMASDQPAPSMVMTADLSTYQAMTTFFPTMSSSASDSCYTVCPTSALTPTTPAETPTTPAETPTTTEPTNQPTEPSHTTAKPAPIKGRPNVGLAVGLTLLVLVILTVVIVIAGIFIYKRYGKYRTNYEVLPTDH